MFIYHCLQVNLQLHPIRIEFLTRQAVAPGRDPFWAVVTRQLLGLCSCTVAQPRTLSWTVLQSMLLTQVSVALCAAPDLELF